MCVCVAVYGRSSHQPGMVANLACDTTVKMESSYLFIYQGFGPEISHDEFGLAKQVQCSVVPSRRSDAIQVQITGTKIEITVVPT